MKATYINQNIHILNIQIKKFLYCIEKGTIKIKGCNDVHITVEGFSCISSMLNKKDKKGNKNV